MDKRTFNLWIDRALLPVFAGTFWSGLELHGAGRHGAAHDIWHAWAVFHVVVSLLFALLAALHVWGYLGWYKGLRRGVHMDRTRRMVLWLTIVGIAVAITGLLLLLVVRGEGTHLGMLHYVAGIVLGLLGVFHILKRWRLLVGNPLLKQHSRHTR